jgi:hypothetical protein
MKHKTSKFSAVLLAAAAVIGYAVVSHAQPPRMRSADGAVKSKGAPDNAAIVAYLSLTETQLASFEAIRANTRTAAEPIFEQIQTKHEALRAAREAGNATLMASLQLEIDALQNQIEKLRADAQVQLVGSLAADQKAKLATLTAAMALFDEARQAAGLGLLTPPEGVGGPAFSPGPGGKGKGKGKGGVPPGAF